MERWSGGIFKNYFRNFIPVCNGEHLLTVVDKKGFYFSLITGINDPITATSILESRAKSLRGAILPYNPGGTVIAMPNGTAFRPYGGSYPIELGVGRVGMYGVRVPLRVDVMWTCSGEGWVALLKSMVVGVLSCSVAVVSSKEGALVWFDGGRLIVNSISFLISALKKIVGNAIVHVIC